MLENKIKKKHTFQFMFCIRVRVSWSTIDIETLNASFALDVIVDST